MAINLSNPIGYNVVYNNGVMNPLVSVIITTYNRKKLVMEAIRSVLKQKPHNYEVIVVDDGSTDGTSEYLKNRNLPIKLINKGNGGPQTARNAGIKAARGKYISFLDSDDLWLPGILRHESEYLETHPQAPLVYCDYYIRIDGRQMKVTKFNQHFRTKHQMTHFNFPPFGSKQALIHISTVMIRHKILNEVGYFNTDQRLFDETDLFNRISEKYRLHYINLPFAVYRLTKDKKHITNIEKTGSYISEGKKYMNYYEGRRKNKKISSDEKKAISEGHRVIALYETLQKLYESNKISKKQFYLKRWTYYFLKQMNRSVFYFEIYGFIIKIVFDKIADSKYEINAKSLLLSLMGDFLIFKIRKTDFEIEIDGNGGKHMNNIKARKSYPEGKVKVTSHLSAPELLFLLEDVLKFLFFKNKGLILQGLAKESRGKANLFLNNSKMADFISTALKDRSKFLSGKVCVVRKIRGQFFYFQTTFFDKNYIISKTLGKYKIGKIILIDSGSRGIKKIINKELILPRIIKKLIEPNKESLKNMMEMVSEFDNFYLMGVSNNIQN